MSQTLDHIKEEIKSLRPAERFGLWRDLGQEFDPPMAESEDGASVEADWDAEIDVRVGQVEKGEVELVPADEVIERVRAKLAARRAELTTAA
jgi:hypothetical protein